MCRCKVAADPHNEFRETVGGGAGESSYDEEQEQAGICSTVEKIDQPAHV